ncbi:WD40 repeat-like protein [Mycena leptocephala]|nr:WD40 repeat-like protein [Mycena leptocephala]
MTKGKKKFGRNSLFRRSQSRTNSRDAQPPESKSFILVKIQSLARKWPSSGIRWHKQPGRREVSSSEIARAPTEGGASLSDASSKDIKTLGKQKICKKAKLIWQGLYKLAQVIEPILPAPFDTPFKIFNAISDAAEQCFDNEEELKAMMERLSSRLVEANRVLLRSDDYGIDVTESSTKLARLIVNEALDIHKIQRLSLTGKTLGQNNIAQQINKCLDRLNQGTEEYHRTLIQAIARSVHQMLEFTLTSQLSFAPNALFNAAGKAGTSSRRACTPNTRENLLDRLETWALDPVLGTEDPSAGATSVFWLSGMAGTGKSTIAYTLCERLRVCGRLGASFFCSRNEEQTRSRKFIIPTIVRQLVSAYKPLVDILRDAPLVIVIDALDEIEDNQGAEFIKELTGSLSQTMLRGLKFLLTSRPHPDIVKSCRQLRAHFCLEEIKPSEAKEDVRRFLRNEFSHLGEEELNPIVEESAGIFIYAATVVRHLRPPGVPLTAGEQKERLKRLLAVGFGKGITGDEQLVDSLYETVTREALRNTGPEVKTPQRLLYAVVTAHHPLTLRTLASLVVDASEEADEAAINDNLDKVQNSLNSLYAVLYVSERDNCVYAYHKSFDDFILNRSQLAQSAAIYFPNRTQECFEILNKSLQFNICDLKSSYLFDQEDEGLRVRIATRIGPKLRYACQHWAEHLTSVRHNDHHVKQLAALLLDFSRLKVLFWMEVMNLLKADCRCALYQAHSWSLQIPDTEELNAYLSASQRLWASFAAGEPSLSTPHLYVSSLTAELAMPESSTLVGWRQCFPGLPVMECKGIARIAMLMSARGHTDSVTSTAFSPDGARVVSGSHDGTVRIWNATTSAELRRIQGHTDSVTSVAFSPDGAHVVSGSHDMTVRIWDATTGVKLGRMGGHTESVMSAAFSPDGTRVVSGSSDNTVRIWDATAGTEVGRMEHADWVTSAAFSPDGTCIVSGSGDNTLRIWDATTGAELVRMKEHTETVRSVAFSPDGTRIVSGSHDYTVRIWDVKTGAELVCIWDAMTGAEPIMKAQPEWFTSAAFSPDGTRIVSGSMDKTVRIWDSMTGAELGRMEGHTNSVVSAAFSPDGARIVSGSDDKTVRIWDATTGAEPARMEGHTESVVSAAFSPDSLRVVSGSHDMTVRIWNAKTGAELQRMEGHTRWVTSAAFSPDGTRIVSSAGDATMCIWDAMTGAELGRIEGHDDTVTSAAFSPDSARIVSASRDYTVSIWDATSGAELGRMEGHTDFVTSAAFSPDGTRIVSSSGDKTVRIWDATTSAELGRLEEHTNAVASAAFSPDGARVVSGSQDNTVRIWDVETSAELKRMEGHTDLVTSTAFSPDGEHVVSGSHDMTVRIWDATTGAELRRMEGHTDHVTSVAFSPDSAHIVSGSIDNTVRFWDATTMPKLGRMEEHTNSFMFVPFSANDACARSSSQDSNVHTWQPSEHLPYTLDPTGWLVLHHTLCIRLFWYPPQLRLSLLIPPCFLLISNHGYARLDPFSVALGPDWAKCYRPLVDQPT